MRISQDPFFYALLAVALFVSCPSWGQVQDSSGAASTPPNPRVPERSIEDLNRLGAETAMPPFVESPINIDSGFRQKLFSEGVALRSQLTVMYAQNSLEAPVPTDTQSYVGDDPFQSVMYNWTLTADLRQMHLKHAELYVCGGWYWVSWNPAGPKAFQMHTLYLYKAFADRRVEFKAGYIGNNMELIGLSIGGSLTTAAQGVYAVLPYEVGVSNFPLTAPSFNLRIQGPKRTYLKTVAQRSIDPHGGPKEVERNHTGFRFIPNGDKLLLFDEMGYRRTASATAHDTWFRAGYIHNSSPFTNLTTGAAQSGNHSEFVLMDYQLRRSNSLHPGQGLYLGGTAMAADSHLDRYDSYYELRLYRKAPFRSRPFDMASLVSYYSGHSKELTDSLVAQGKSVWRASASLTGSYSLRVHPGQYMSMGFSYIHGPAITPRVSDTLTFSTNYQFFF
jgi:porin